MSDMTEAEAERALSDLQKLSCWPTAYDGSHRHLARLKDLSSQLVGRFAMAAESATRDQFGAGDLTRYTADLIVPREQQIEVALLKAISSHYVLQAEASQKRYSDQHVLIRELVDLIMEHAPVSLESFFLEDWRQATNDAQKLRVVIDQVASLTDPGAYALHKSLSSRFSS
jgi:dGTPase